MTRMNFIFILILYNVVVFANGIKCPSRCECDRIENYRRARCINQNLVNVHTGVPHMVQILDLSENTINVLDNNVLQDLNLTSLYNLTLAYNTIHSVGLNALEGLKSLHALDLSYNRLEELPEQFLYHNQEIQLLNLRGNKFWYMPSPFLESRSLSVLDISKCQINHISGNTFSKMPGLTELNLSENIMIQIGTNVITPLPRLQKLDISSNPWSCNGKVMEFHKTVKERQIEMQPQCMEEKTDESKPKMFEKMMLDPNLIGEVEKIDQDVDWEDVIKINENEIMENFELPEEMINKTSNSIWSFRKKFNNSVAADFGLIVGLIIGISITLLVQICVTNCSLNKLDNSACSGGTMRRTVNSERRSLIPFQPLDVSVDTPPALRRNSNLNQMLLRSSMIGTGGHCENARQARILRPTISLRDSWQYIDFNRNTIPEESIPPGTPPPTYRQVMINAHS